MSAAQLATCRRLAVVPTPPARSTVVGFALSRAADLKPLNAIRHPIARNSNGWFVWRGPAIPPDDDAFFSPLHVAHLDDHAPELEPYLALPPGWGVILAPGYEDVWFDEALLDV